MGLDFGIYLLSPAKKVLRENFKNTKTMKTIILTQKNVCAFLGLIMALTIVFSASAHVNNDSNHFQFETIVEIKEGSNALKDEMVSPIEIDFTNIKEVPSITLINKYGEVVAEFYGPKSSIEKRFEENIKKGEFITSYGNHEFYLVN